MIIYLVKGARNDKLAKVKKMKLLDKTTLYNYIITMTEAGHNLGKNYFLRKFNKDATVYVLEKEASEKHFTPKRVLAAANIESLENYVACSRSITEYSLYKLNKYNYTTMILIENVETVRKNNGQYRTLILERKKITEEFLRRKNKLIEEARMIRFQAEKEASENRARRLYFILNLKIKDFLEKELERAELNTERIKELASALNSLKKCSGVSSAAFDFVKSNGFDLGKKITVECSSTNAYNRNVEYNFEITATLLDFIIKGVYSLFLGEFKTKTGLDWYNNTANFKCGVEALKHGI